MVIAVTEPTAERRGTSAFLIPTGGPHDVINVDGKACALGHPIGASGARLTMTLIVARWERGLRRGAAALSRHQ